VIFVLDPLPENRTYRTDPDRGAVDWQIGIVSAVMRVREIIKGSLDWYY
jgi:hypothetical protein